MCAGLAPTLQEPVRASHVVTHSHQLQLPANSRKPHTAFKRNVVDTIAEGRTPPSSAASLTPCNLAGANRSNLCCSMRSHAGGRDHPRRRLGVRGARSDEADGGRLRTPAVGGLLCRASRSIFMLRPLGSLLSTPKPIPAPARWYQARDWPNMLSVRLAQERKVGFSESGRLQVDIKLASFAMRTRGRVQQVILRQRSSAPHTRFAHACVGLSHAPSKADLL